MSPPPPPTPPKIHIYTHPLPRLILLPRLLPLLPSTLPVVRRIQFHFQSPYARVLSTISPDAPPPPPPPHNLNDEPTTTPTATPTAPNPYPTANADVETPPFLVAYLDRSRAPETECWIFSSIELPSSFPPSSPSPPSSPLPSPTTLALAHAQLLALLQHIQTLPLPPGFPASHPRDLLLVGSLHVRVLELLKGERVRAGEGRKVLSGDVEEWRAESTPLPAGDGSEADADVAPVSLARGEGAAEGSGKDVIEPLEPHRATAADRIHGSTDPRGENAQGRVRGHTVPTMKFLFPPAVCTDAVRGAGGAVLPAGLAWDVVREGEYGLVKARTAIPRQARTMRLLGSVGVRVRVRAGASGSDEVGGEGVSGAMEGGTAATRDGGNGKEERGPLVAWAFLGPDGSLTSLHVEPAFRGRGIAKMR